MQEFGGDNKEEEDDAEAAAEEDVTEAAAKRAAPGAVDDAKTKAVAVQKKGAGTGKLEGRLIVREKRTTGSVSWRGEHCTQWVGYWGGSLIILLAVASVWRLPEGGARVLHRPDPRGVHVRDAGQPDHEQLHAHLVAGEHVRPAQLVLPDPLRLLGCLPGPLHVRRVSTLVLSALSRWYS